MIPVFSAETLGIGARWMTVTPTAWKKCSMSIGATGATRKRQHRYVCRNQSINARIAGDMALPAVQHR
jgi:hypothetical protein